MNVTKMLLVAGIVLMVGCGAALAQPALTAVTVTPSSDGGQTYSLSLQVLLVMTALTVLPSVLLTMSSFTRIIIVLAILRQALGTMQTPPNQILIGLALFLSAFVMLPVLSRINDEAVQPYLQDQLTAQAALEKASVPLRQFMLPQTREEDLALFVRLSGRDQIESRDSVPFVLFLPAFLTNKLQIGFLIFLPFLVIDIVVASVLMSMGMMMLSPMIISLPFKIMLFVLIDGWTLVLGTLASSFT
jgi:flagellar biosynthesis protein FliP